MVDRKGQIIDSIGTQVIQYAQKISPDQSKIVSTVYSQSSSNTDLWIYELDRGVNTRFTFDQAHDYSPIWSPDGKEIVYRSEDKGTYSIFRKHASGLRKRELMYSDSVLIWPSSWSSDGKYILFEKIALETTSDIWVMPVDSPQTSYPYIATKSDEYDPVFSPDGRWIAYGSNETTAEQIYVVSFPELEGKRQVSINEGDRPHWSVDGKELYFLSNSDDIMAVEVNGSGTSFQIGKITNLFHVNASRPGEIYDNFSDGERFLLNTRADIDNVNSIILITNWHKEFEKK